MKKIRSFVVVNFLILCFMFIVLHNNMLHKVNSADTIFEEKRVLFISSYSPSFPTYFNQLDGLQDAFEGYPVILDVEFMDSKRFFTTENIDNFTTSLTYKLTQVEYDLIVTSDDNAIQFVMDNRSELFADLPIVFFGANNEVNAKLHAEEANVTGVIEAVSMEETIRLGLRLNPDVQTVIALVDHTVTGQSEMNSFYALESAFPEYEFSSIDFGAMTLPSYLDAISDVDEQSVMILISALKDVTDTTYEFDEMNRLIIENAKQPIYHLYEFGIEDGLIGGMVVSHYVQGETAANLVLDYFQGTEINDLELVEESPNLYVINYEVFKHYGYDEDLLPEGTVFLNRDYSLFEQYSLSIVLAALFLIIQTVIIVSLIVTVRHRNKARLEVLSVNDELNVVNDQLLYKSYHDELTGLFNRNYFEEQFPRLKEILDDIPISVVVFDVNGLKLINDAFGHIKGDRVLIETSKLLLTVFKKSDIFRIGGDEFAVIPYGKSEKEVSLLINKFSREVETIKIEGVALSVSIGYAFLDENKTLNEIFIEAEDWMYREKLSQVPSNRSATIDAIIATINQKDLYSEEHSKRVSELSAKIAEYMNVGDNMVSEIRTAGLLHDIGKIIVPSNILNKASKLTKEEYEEIKKHSEIGFRILNSVSSMRNISEYVFCHHERIDGKGYPRGLKNDQIPIQSRIIGIADAMDAMLTDRLYRKKLTHEECKEELRKHQGTQFCSKAVDVVLEHFEDIVNILEKH